MGVFHVFKIVQMVPNDARHLMYVFLLATLTRCSLTCTMLLYPRYFDETSHFLWSNFFMQSYLAFQKVYSNVV